MYGQEQHLGDSRAVRSKKLGTLNDFAEQNQQVSQTFYRERNRFMVPVKPLLLWDSVAPQNLISHLT